MGHPRRVCVRCGAPAVLRRGGLPEGPDRIRDLCESCAEVELNGWGLGGVRPSRMPQRMEIGIILTAVGSFILIISLLADWLEFGRSPGLGWKQLIGVVLAAGAVMLGAMFRALVLVIIGLIIGGLSVLADGIGFGGEEGFGYQQWAGVLVGVVAIAIGLRLLRERTGRSGPDSSAEQG